MKQTAHPFLVLFFIAALFLSFRIVVAETEPSVVYLAFPTREYPTPSKIDLTKDAPLGSAFLKQLQRQAILMAVRDELGGTTRDAFFGETVPAEFNAISIENPDTFLEAWPKYVDHRQFVRDLENSSRDALVAALRKVGTVGPGSLSVAIDDQKGEAEIDKMLHDWSIVPQFEAVCRTHALIREKGETLFRLALLVRGYTQLQMLTTYTARDTHRVFQARAILYAQRAVVKYGETLQTRSLRAVAWALNDFHRIAREEFGKIVPQPKEPDHSLSPEDIRTELARAYAEFDISRIDRWIETLESSPERPFAKLLRFFLTDLTFNGRTLGLPYGQSIVAALPDCELLYHRIFTFDNFSVPASPDGSPFYEHLSRILPGLLEDGEGGSEENSGVLGNLFAAPQAKGMSTEQHYQRLADLLKTLREKTPKQDRGEPSLQVLATLLEDREFETVSLLAMHLRGRNGYPEEIVSASEKAIGQHPAFPFFGDYIRDPAKQAAFLQRPKSAAIPYELLSIHCLADDRKENIFYSDGFFAPMVVPHLFADRENVHDMTHYLRRAATQVSVSKKKKTRFFAVDLMIQLCPNNPFTVFRDVDFGGKFNDEWAEESLKKYAAYPNLVRGIANRYRQSGNNGRAFALYEQCFKDSPTYDLMDWLVKEHLKRNEPDKAIDVLQTFIADPVSDLQLHRANAEVMAGKILLAQGKIPEATPYFQSAARTGSSWGLRDAATFLETTGQFGTAERIQQMNVTSYPEVGPFDEWGLAFRANRPTLKDATDEILERYDRFNKASPEDLETRKRDKIENWQVLYPCYCMDMPIPESLGKDPFVEEFYRETNELSGFLAYFDALEKGDKDHAEKLLRLMRAQFWNTGINPFFRARQSLPESQRKWKNPGNASQMLAAVFELDQRSEKPGRLQEDELEFLIRLNYVHELDVGNAPKLLYLIGRYYSVCGEKEKAVATLKRLLGLRITTDSDVRSLAVKELRKLGMSDKEYVRWMKSDPKIRRDPLSFSPEDIFCRFLFRDFSDSPAAAQLATPVAVESYPEYPAFGPVVKPGNHWFAVSRILFRGRIIPAEKSVCFLAVSNGHLTFSGSGLNDRIGQKTGERRSDGALPILIGNIEPRLNGLIAFHENDIVLVLCLDPTKSPESLTPSPDSDCVRSEWKRVP